MIGGILNNFTVNKQNSPLFTGVDTSNPVQTKADNLESSPQTDTVSISNKQPMSKKTKAILTLGGIATIVIGAVLAVKGFKSHKITKALEQIEQRFVKLKENVPEAQKTFKDTFLRSDISEKETVEMLDRYKEIEKLGITGTKEEYIQALFNETKQNFGLGKELKLEMIDFPDARRGGNSSPLLDVIILNKKWPIKKLGNAVFHELRHAKQDYFAANYDINKFFKIFESNGRAAGEHDISYLQRKCGLLEFSKENVPSEYFNYVENCYKGYSDYFDSAYWSMPESAEKYKLYRNIFIEQDAWNSANKITKFLYDFENKSAF
jgi:hypothetical protein